MSSLYNWWYGTAATLVNEPAPQTAAAPTQSPPVLKPVPAPVPKTPQPAPDLVAELRRVQALRKQVAHNKKLVLAELQRWVYTTD